MVPEKIRNVALVGHGGSGKTTLAEALLFVTGATTRQGSIDAGTSMLDFEPEEQERKISLGLSVASVMWQDNKINVIDTPGYIDFSGDAASRTTRCRPGAVCCLRGRWGRGADRDSLAGG